MNEPKKNTVLWWLNRIADDDLRNKALNACKNHDRDAYYLNDAICDMCFWVNTLEGAEFWADKSIDALKNKIPLLPEPYTNKSETI